MNVVVSMFARENDEKRVIRFKKIPVDEKASKLHIQGDPEARDWKSLPCASPKVIANIDNSAFILL
jgi:hypothetical protein